MGTKRKSSSKRTGKRQHPRISAKSKTGGVKLRAGSEFEKLLAVQKRLRSPNGCPWDLEQSHDTLRTYLIEEAYEVLDALESRDDTKFIEELGDLLLQITFHSQIASEEARFNISDVVRGIREKMIRRHPHVFGSKRVKDSAEVLKNWEKIKVKEREAVGKGPASESLVNREAEVSTLDGVPRSLPATLEGLQLTKKAARIGFDWPDSDGIFAKIEEERGELRHAVQSKDSCKIEEELGDLLFAVVNLARFLHADPEIALKKANAKFVRRFRAMEKTAAGGGSALADVPREQMEALWNRAKDSERVEDKARS